MDKSDGDGFRRELQGEVGAVFLSVILLQYLEITTGQTRMPGITKYTTVLNLFVNELKKQIRGFCFMYCGRVLSIRLFSPTGSFDQIVSSHVINLSQSHSEKI